MNGVLIRSWSVPVFVDAEVALGYIPWFESAVVVHCKVVVCDNLFGLEP